MREQPAELRDYVAVIRGHGRSILVAILVFAVAGLLYAKTRPPQYRSTARVLVLQSATGPFGQTQTGASQNKPINLETEAEIVNSTAVAQLAKAELKSPKTVQQLANQADASFTTDSQVLTIGFTAGSPTTAQAGAQAFAQAYLKFKTAQITQAVAQQQATVDARLSALNKQLSQANDVIATHPATSAETRDAKAQKELLLQQIGQVQKDNSNLGSFTVHPGDIIGTATTPSHKVQSSLTYIVVGLLIGIVLGFGQAFFRDALDRRLTGIGDFEQVLRASVMAVIPKRKEAGRKDEIVFLESPNDPASEGYRTLRTGLLFAAAGQNGRAFMITSASEGEGKSTTAVNLAVALAQANVPVVLMDADLRKPTIHRFFNTTMAPGVIELLRGATDLYQALRDVGVPKMRLISAGDVAAESPEVFSPGDLAAIIQRMKDAGTMVIVDTPPLIVSDPLALAPYMDGVIFVADSTSVTAEGIAPLIERLTMVGGRVVGGVLNKYDPRKSRGYAAEYGYGTYGRSTYAQEQAQGRNETARDLRLADPIREPASDDEDDSLVAG